MNKMDSENKTTDQLLHDHTILFNLILGYGVPMADLNHLLEIEQELSIREESA